jgi:hypothetical protein
MSLYTKVSAFEVLFGDFDEETPNLANSVCQSVMKVSLNSNLIARNGSERACTLKRSTRRRHMYDTWF